MGLTTELRGIADALPGSMNAAEYKHAILGLIFLKCISAAFEECHAAVLAECESDATVTKLAENFVRVPQEACWNYPKAHARQSAQAAAAAVAAIKRNNPAPRGVLPQDQGRSAPDMRGSDNSSA